MLVLVVSITGSCCIVCALTCTTAQSTQLLIALCGTSKEVNTISRKNEQAVPNAAVCSAYRSNSGETSSCLLHCMVPWPATLVHHPGRRVMWMLP